MKKIYRFLIIAVLVCSSLATKAQNDGLVFSLMPHIPYNNFLNPGIRVPYNGLVGVGFSNFNVSVYNSSIRYSNIFISDDDGGVVDGVKFVNSLKEQDNFFNFNMSMDFVNAGFRIKKLFFNIDWRMRINADFQYSKDFLGFFVLGNGGYMGRDNPCDFNIGLNASAYIEYAVAAQYDINDKLTVGIRPKFLSGIANATFTNKETKIYTDPNTYAISADVELDIKMASILESDLSRIGDITNIFDDFNLGSKKNFDIKENVGFGIDFGASYKINDQWGVAASVYDLGFIKWRDAKVKKVSKTDVTINDQLFDDYHDLKDLKLDYESMVGDIIDEVWGNDSLVGGETYKTSLRTRLILQGYFELNPMVRFSAFGQICSTIGGVKPAITLAYSGAFWDILNVSAHYTLSTYSGSSVGLGLGVHAGPFNAFIASDNVLAFTKVASSTVEFATAYRTSGIRCGIVWTIGKYQGSEREFEYIDEDDLIMEKTIDTEKIDKAEEQFKKELEERKINTEEPKEE